MRPWICQGSSWQIQGCQTHLCICMPMHFISDKRKKSTKQKKLKKKGLGHPPNMLESHSKDDLSFHSHDPQWKQLPFLKKGNHFFWRHDNYLLNPIGSMSGISTYISTYVFHKNRPHVNIPYVEPMGMKGH